MKNALSKSVIAAVIILSANVFAQTDSTKTVKFTQDEFNVIATYIDAMPYRPAKADSATLLILNSLRTKIEAVRNKKTLLNDFAPSALESNIILNIMRNEFMAAVALLRLQQKLAPATNGAAKNKKD